VYGYVHPGSRWVIVLVRFEQYVVGEVAAAGSDLHLLERPLLSIEDRRFVFSLLYLPPMGLQLLCVVAGNPLL
jgi:hypothetical protein